MTPSDFLKYSRIEVDNPQVCYVKQLSPKRWKTFMIQVLEALTNQQPEHKNLIKDLITIVSTVPSANFIQAGLQIRPFKPQFIQEQVLMLQVTQSTTTSTITNSARFKGENLNHLNNMKKKERITEKTLKNQLNSEYHPYRFIVKNFCRLLELKYKQLIDVRKLKVTSIQEKLRDDLKIFTQFMHLSSKPYKKLFKLQKNDEQQKVSKKMSNFIEGYILEHRQINSSCHKVLLYACRTQYAAFFNEKIQDFPIVEGYNIPEEFKIDGCYVRSINSLMQFSQKHNHQESINKLLQFRSNLLRDVDEYYKSIQGQSKELELNAESQIQIIRFIIAKLKGWASQIYGKIKFLELIYGEEQIAYKFQQASFIYTQLCLCFEILGIE